MPKLLRNPTTGKLTRLASGKLKSGEPGTDDCACCSEDCCDCGPLGNYDAALVAAWRNMTVYIHVPAISVTDSGGTSHALTAGVYAAPEDGSGQIGWRTADGFYADGGATRVVYIISTPYGAAPTYPLTAFRLTVGFPALGRSAGPYDKVCGDHPLCNYPSGFFVSAASTDPMLDDCNPLP